MEKLIMKWSPIWIEGTTLDDTWFKLLYALKEHGRRYLITRGSYEGQYRLAFDDVAGFIKYPHQRPLAPIMPEGLPCPTSDEVIEKYFVEYLMDGNIKDKEDYKYGTFISGGKYIIPEITLDIGDDLPYLYNKQSIIVPNQLEWIINHFKEKGFGNEHCYISVGYPESNFAYDLPYTNEQERKTSPCLRGLDFRIIEDDGINYLLTKVIYRSWDLINGFCTNMGGFTLLNEFISNELGIEPGPLSFTCKSLHAYDFELEFLDKRLGK